MKDLFLRPVDLPKLLLGAACAAALFLLTLVAAEHVPFRTKHLSEASLPYRFSYPGDFHRDDLPELPAEARSLDFLSGISKGDDGGVLVGAFVPAAPAQVVSAVRAQFARHGGRVTGEKQVSVGGIEGVELQAESSVAEIHDRTTILFVLPTLAYWIKCVGHAGGRDDTEAACEKVLGSFELTNPDAAPSGPPRIPGAPA